MDSRTALVYAINSLAHAPQLIIFHPLRVAQSLHTIRRIESLRACMGRSWVNSPYKHTRPEPYYIPGTH